MPEAAEPPRPAATHEHRPADLTTALGSPDDAPVRSPGEQPLWLAATLAVAGLYMCAVSALRPMVSYRALQIGAPTVDLGLIASSFAVVALVVAIPVGRWIDRFGEVRFLRLGCILLAIDAFAIIAIRSTWGLAASQAFLGLGQVQMVVAGQALMAKRGAPRGRERRVRLFSVAVALGQLVGPVAAGALAESGSHAAAPTTPGVSVAGVDMVFAACGIVACAAVAIAVALPAILPPPERVPWTHPDETVGGPAAIREVLRKPGMLPMLLASSSTTATADVLTAYVPAYAVAQHLSVGFVGLLLSLRATSILGARIVMGWLLRRLKHSQLLVGGLIAAGAACVAIATTGNAAALAVLMLAVGLGQGFGQPITIVWVAEQVPADRRALALGVRITVNRLGQLVVPTTAGILAGVAGLPAVFVAVGALLSGSGAFASTATIELGGSEEPVEAAPV